MLRKLSAVAIAVLLAGGFSVGQQVPNGGQASAESSQSAGQPGLPHSVPLTPQMQKFVKEHQLHPGKFDPANTLNTVHGKKFQEPGNGRVNYQPTDSKVPMLVLLVQFPDVAKGAPEKLVPAKYYQHLIFGDHYDPYQLDMFDQYATYHGIKAPTDRTMQNAYQESSYGKVQLVEYNDMTDVGWITLPKNYDDYLGQKGYQNGNAYGYANVGELVSEAVKIADKKIDFSKYAVDGQVPNIFVIHEGSGAEWSLDPMQIWSHSWGMLSALYYGDWYKTGYYAADANEDGTVSDQEWNTWHSHFVKTHTYDGVLLNHYTIEPEIGGNITGYNAATGTYNKKNATGPYPATVGVFAHEFGHALGLPDLYDTDYTSEGDGNFSLMSGGSWMQYPNGAAYAGNSPTEFDPFSKIFLGWLDPITVTPDDGARTITLQPVNEAPDVVKLPVPGSNGTEYFLFENQQQEGFNKGLHAMGEDAHGLVAWHVDENVLSKAGRPNNVENWKTKRFQYNQKKVLPDGTIITHYGLSVVQADGDYDLEHGRNRGGAKDYFKTGDALTPQGPVNSGSYYFWRENSPVPSDSGIHVTDITKNADGSITAKFFYAFGSENQ
ncbi:MAG TPA: M6 family metalloprotease domain-containing protein [Bacillales bacterium]|nr:M6 family metalloprotease domain-containing protein [Bacillales bacterium]